MLVDFVAALFFLVWGFTMSRICFSNEVGTSAGWRAVVYCIFVVYLDRNAGVDDCTNASVCDVHESMAMRVAMYWMLYMVFDFV